MNVIIIVNIILYYCVIFVVTITIFSIVIFFQRVCFLHFFPRFRILKVCCSKYALIKSNKIIMFRIYISIKYEKFQITLVMRTLLKLLFFYLYRNILLTLQKKHFQEKDIPQKAFNKFNFVYNAQLF